MPTLGSDGVGGGGVVAGDHPDLEPGRKLGDGFGGLRLDGVGHGDECGELVVDGDEHGRLAAARRRVGCGVDQRRPRRHGPSWPGCRSAPGGRRRSRRSRGRDGLEGLQRRQATPASRAWLAIASRPGARCRSRRPRPGRAPRARQPPTVVTAVTAGLPWVMVPVLSSTTAVRRRACSRASPLEIRMPSSAARPVPTMTAVGVASPRAQGQAMISTAMVVVIAIVRFSVPGPKNAQAIAVRTAVTMTAARTPRRPCRRGAAWAPWSPGRPRRGG